MTAAAAHEILARRLEFHGPGVMRGTRRISKPDAPWDALVGVLIAGAKWRSPVRSNEATGDDRAESDAADREEVRGADVVHQVGSQVGSTAAARGVMK